MFPRPPLDVIVALLVAFALAATPALSRAPGDSAWHPRAIAQAKALS